MRIGRTHGRGGELVAVTVDAAVDDLLIWRAVGAFGDAVGFDSPAKANLRLKP